MFENPRFFRIKFEDDILEEIKEHCDEVGISISYFVRRATHLVWDNIKKKKKAQEGTRL